ncbi:MAG: hypothetical protein K6T78_16190 [Alicyclobacillus sp.]|nr:hypothetical protein [Alicyclobacillus sp.]
MTVALKERLSCFPNELVQVVNPTQQTAEIIVEEKSDSGRACIHVGVQHLCLCFHQIDKKRFEYVKEQRCADSVVMEIPPDNPWRLHIFELKKKIGHNNLIQIMKQFQGAFLRALALAGILDLGKPDSIICYAGFREDVTQEPAGLVALKPMAYPSDSQPYVSWIRGRLRLTDFACAKLVKIKLDESTGCGHIVI